MSLEDARPHAWDQPAVRWPDGTGDWFWRGIRLPASLVARLPALTGPDIASIVNVELRRLAVKYLGMDAFLRACGAARLAQDVFGRWTEVEVGGEPLVAIEVVDATAEPEGTYRRFFLRVPPETRTARAGVLGMFGFDRAEDYVVAVQT